MKKQIIIAAAFSICLTSLMAQERFTADGSLTAKLEKEFQGAKDIEWNKEQDTHFAQFSYRDESWLAYYHKGALVATARKIAGVQQLPVVVQRSLESFQESRSKKHGEFTMGPIYELTQNGSTRYVIAMESTQNVMTVAIDGTGYAAIKKKEPRTPALEGASTEQLIAKKNKNHD